MKCAARPAGFLDFRMCTASDPAIAGTENSWRKLERKTERHRNTMQNYKIIACDLDETLLSTDRSVCERNVNAIRAAAAKGVRFVCSSGRGYMSFQNTLREIGLYDQPGQYSISFNGSCITENRGNRVLYLDGISWDFADTIYRRGLTYEVCMHIYTQETVYVYNLNEDEKDFLNNRQTYTEIYEPDLSFLRDRQIDLEGDYGPFWAEREPAAGGNFRASALIVQGMRDETVRPKQFDLMRRAFLNCGCEVKCVLHMNGHVTPANEQCYVY